MYILTLLVFCMSLIIHRLHILSLSPVKFSTKADAGCILFIPPNLDSAYWELEGRPSLTGSMRFIRGKRDYLLQAV